MQQPVGQTWNVGTDFKWGEGTTGPPAGDVPGSIYSTTSSG